ncbi:MAG: secondary thiamine-phosphate synthase enzyme [Omnitrophica bacterium RIFCSPLOWO2_01_FULL_45_24]|nr:MAG: secondary thiamine-phosphate synthase enzyme [Omnitrophica bacterium RIFCSPLOWO2_01_FULL_45_24]
MKILNEKIELKTKGNGDLINITDRVSDLVASSDVKKGQVTVFVAGSTAAITTFEYEPGLIRDVKELCDKLIPRKTHYHHDDTWGDANGFSHLRAALFGPSLVVPINDKKAVLGTWQQVVLAEFDNRPRNREVVIQIIGE